MREAGTTSGRNPHGRNLSPWTPERLALLSNLRRASMPSPKILPCLNVLHGLPVTLKAVRRKIEQLNAPVRARRHKAPVVAQFTQARRPRDWSTGYQIGGVR